MRYLVAGVQRLSDEANFQETLAGLAVPRRVFCMCMQPPIEMYVPFVRGQYSLSCMPGTSTKHASGCNHYEPPLSISGAAGVMGTAIDSNESGEVTLRLDFAMSKIAGRAPPAPTGLAPEVAKADPTKLTMRGLLHYLWQEAGFHKWSPRMQGKRNDWVLSKYLMAAAANKRMRAGALSDMLVIPRPAPTSDTHGSTDIHVSLQLARASTDSTGARRLALVAGEVLGIEKTAFAFQIRIKGLDHGLMVSQELHKMIEKAFVGQIAMWQPGANRLMMLGTFFTDTVGNPVLSELTLMNVTNDFLPYESLFEERMITRLVDSQRRFTKGLRFNLNTKIPIAVAVLTDTVVPTAIFILNPGADENILNKQVAEAVQENLATLVWRAGLDAEPALPPDNHTQRIQ